MRNVLIRPLFTEKNTEIYGPQNQYGFVVRKDANKIDIARAVEKKYSVTVENVNTINIKGKTKTMFRRSGRFTGKTPAYKKAIITIKEGETIEIVEQA